MHFRRAVIAVAPLLLGLLLHTSAAAAELPSEQVARDLGLQRALLKGPGGEVIGCRLHGEANTVSLFADLPYATVDGRLTTLPDAPRARGGDLVMTPASRDALRAQLGLAPARPSPAGFTVVIDPGHGGNDPGAVGVGGTTEKEVTLAISLALAKALRDEGVRVVMTRTTDVRVDLDRRAQIANEAGCDLFVSIHANAAGDRSATGHLVIVPADEWEQRDLGNVADRALDAAADRGLVARGLDPRDLSPEASATLFGVLLEEYRRRSALASDEIVAALSRRMQSRDRGTVIDPRGLRVMRKTYCPAVLVEVDFLSNPTIEQRLTDRAYQERIARAVAEGVMAFLRKHNGAAE